VFTGIAQWDGDRLWMNREEGTRVEIQPEWFARFQQVTSDEVRGILLGADAFVRLRVGALPQNAEGFERMGLKWPET
jgi:hypothetical protein